MKEFLPSDILTLSGLPRQRGRVHGETLRAKIKELINRWKDWLTLNASKSTDQYISDLCSRTNFISAIRRWTPGLLEEVIGISEGSGIGFNEIFAFQLQDEEWWFRQEHKQSLREPTTNCSSIGWQGSTTIVAQNMDMPDYLDGYQVVLRIIDPQSEVEALIFSTAGLIALNGLNNHGIGVVCNNLSQLNHSSDGLPVAFVHRGVLEKKTFTDAKSFLEGIRHASGQNYLLGGIGQMEDLECSANQVVAFTQPGWEDRLCHTNHPFANTDYRRPAPATNQTDQALPSPRSKYDINSQTRYKSISRRLDEFNGDQVDPEALKMCLQSHDSHIHPVCRHSKPSHPWMTLGTSIMDLAPHPVLHICPGPPCSSVFKVIDFNN